jgi:hypothetical protein
MRSHCRNCGERLSTYDEQLTEKCECCLKEELAEEEAEYLANHPGCDIP